MEDPTPPLKEMKLQRGTNVTRKFRTFNPTQYSKTEWLTGSANLNKLFCWPCVLFGKTTSKLNCPWVTGYDDLSNIYLALVRHGKSKEHLNSEIKLKLFGNVRIDEALAQSAVISVQQHNHKVRQNREVVKRLVIAALYLSRQELAFRGHDESAESSNKGNYVEFVHAFAEVDPLLVEHFA